MALSYERSDNHKLLVTPKAHSHSGLAAKPLQLDEKARPRARTRTKQPSVELSLELWTPLLFIGGTGRGLDTCYSNNYPCALRLHKYMQGESRYTGAQSSSEDEPSAASASRSRAFSAAFASALSTALPLCAVDHCRRHASLFC